jgi:integrase
MRWGVSSPLQPLIALIESTGRRLGSVVNHRWDDFDLKKQTIRWRAARHDSGGHR